MGYNNMNGLPETPKVIKQWGPISNDLPKTPEEKLNRELRQSESALSRKYYQTIDEIRRTPLTDEEFDTQMRALKTSYKGLLNEQRNKVSGRIQQLSMVKQLAENSYITPEKANELGWKMVLPKDIFEATFPKPQTSQRERAPFSPSRVAGYRQLASNYVDEQHVTIPDRWTKAKNEAVDRQKLLNQYKNWRAEIGYDNMDQGQKDQVDYAWDITMQEQGFYGNDPDNKRQGWYPKNDVEIQKLRARGKLTQAAANRLSPADKSIRGSIAGNQGNLKPIDDITAQAIFKEASGDWKRATEIAKQRGYKIE